MGLFDKIQKAMGMDEGKAAVDEPADDVTELMAAIAALNGEKPPSGRVVVPDSILSPITTRIEKEEEAAAAIVAAAAAEKEANPEIGDQMKDGSVYAGLTEDGTQKIFAMPTDLDVAMTFNDAAKRITELNADNALGHDDWQIPSLKNLEVLYENKKEGSLKDTFNTDYDSEHPNYYCSSTTGGHDSSIMFYARFNNGYEDWGGKDANQYSCRPVRLAPVAPSPA